MSNDNISSDAKALPVPYVPCAWSDTGLPGFTNTKDHFEIYLKVRGIVSEELTYRRNRQWDFVKWAITTLLTIIGGLLVLWAKADAKISGGMAYALDIIVFVIATAAVIRILHDAGVIAYRSTLFKVMDETFEMKIDDHNYKLAARMKRWWAKCPSEEKSQQQAENSKEEPNQMEDAQADGENTQWVKKQPTLWSSIVYCYLLMIGGLAIAAWIIIAELQKERSPNTSESKATAKAGVMTPTEQAKPPPVDQPAPLEGKPSPPQAAETKAAIPKEDPSKAKPTPTERKADPPKAPEPQRDSARKLPPA